MPTRTRFGLLVLGVGAAILLLVARFLTPSPSGNGTHQQLGLPPCTMVTLLGRPCPFCGMTTAWSWLLRGEIKRAANANAGGLLAGILAILLSVWLTMTAIKGRWWLVRPNPRMIFALSLCFSVVTLTDWIYRLWITS
ncbi:MAG: DUF2752 domain-containing protein [Pirellulales bacterium]|nr:DUF2752 domain-containing protein [Pirellulales bacterium]